MSEFYSSIAKYYEEIFPYSEAKLHFVLNHLPKANHTGQAIRCLDLAASTGLLAKALSEKGLDVSAMDLDESMVSLASKKGGFKVFQGDMSKLNFDASFDLLTCFGNSMPHLSDENQILQFFQGVFNALSDDGVFLMQWINFKPFLKIRQEEKSKPIGKDVDFQAKGTTLPKTQYLGALPTIETQTHYFLRRYYDAFPHFCFYTELQEKTSHDVLCNKTLLYPITLNVALDLLQRAGFSDFEVFSSWAGASFDDEKISPIILSSRKVSQKN